VKTPAKKKRGHPTHYKAEYAEQAYKLCILGLIDQELADFFGVQTSTINNWKKAHPEFLESIKGGREKADANVAVALYKRAIGYSHKSEKIMQHDGVVIRAPYTEHYPPDTQAASLFLRNRQPKRWRDKQEVELSGEIGIAEAVKEARERAKNGKT